MTQFVSFTDGKNIAGHLHIPDATVECPNCGYEISTEGLLTALYKLKGSLIYRKCPKCGCKNGYTQDMKSDLQAWRKEDEVEEN